MSKTQVQIGPKSKKQEMFLTTTADICVFGGGAGSGKTYLGLMDMLKHVNDNKYRGVVVRRLTPQIHGPGAVFESAESLYRSVFQDQINVRRRDGDIVFPSGAQVNFRHCQHVSDKYNFQGSQVSVFLLDEAQQLEYEQVVYFMSRLRTDADMKPYMRLTCNPDKNSFLREWVDWYLLEDGTPDPAKCGVIRWFIMKDNAMVWGDSREELLTRFGPLAKPLSFTFINANVYDNPVLMQRQPEYVGWLEGLPRVEKARLLEGNWDVTEQASGYWKKDWVEMLHGIPRKITKRVRAWDLASSLPSEVNPDPDYTCGILMSRTEDKCYIVEDCVRFRDRFAGVEQKIIQQAILDGPEVAIIIPQDAGAAGKAYSTDFARRLSEKGFTARIKPTNQSKVMRFGPFASLSELGFVKVLKGEWNSDYFDELENFTGDGKRHDDQVDATADAFWACKSNVEIANFVIPDFSKQTSYNTFKAFGQ